MCQKLIIVVKNPTTEKTLEGSSKKKQRKNKEKGEGKEKGKGKGKDKGKSKGKKQKKKKKVKLGEIEFDWGKNMQNGKEFHTNKPKMRDFLGINYIMSIKNLPTIKKLLGMWAVHW